MARHSSPVQPFIWWAGWANLSRHSTCCGLRRRCGQLPPPCTLWLPSADQSLCWRWLASAHFWLLSRCCGLSPEMSNLGLNKHGVKCMVKMIVEKCQQVTLATYASKLMAWKAGCSWPWYAFSNQVSPSSFGHAEPTSVQVVPKRAYFSATAQGS